MTDVFAGAAWDNVVGSGAPATWFDGDPVWAGGSLAQGAIAYWAIPAIAHVDEIYMKWAHTAQSSEFYIEWSDDVDLGYLPVALGGGGTLTVNPGGTWHVALHAYGGAGSAVPDPKYTDADSVEHTWTYGGVYPASDSTFDLGSGVNARLWRMRIPAGRGNSDLGTIQGNGTIPDPEDPDACPIADFVATPRAGVAPLEVSFTDTSSGPVESWLWDFGDGETSTDENPVHTFAEPGSYDVTLTVGNAGDVCTDSITKASYVNALLSCDSAMIFDVYSIGTAAAPAQTYIGSLCSAFAKEILVEADGLGSGKFSINRYADPLLGTPNPEVSAEMLGTGSPSTPRLVKVRIPDARGDDPVFAFFLESGDFRLIDPGERGGEILVFGGPGILSYLGWGVMWDESYLEDPFHGEDPYDNTWHLYADYTLGTNYAVAFAANGTDATVTSWGLPPVNAPGDDLLLVAAVQVRPVASISSSGWVDRVREDTTGMDMGTGFGDFRYALLDKEIDASATPYQDVLTLGTPTRINAAQVALKRTTGQSPVQSKGEWGGGGSRAISLDAPATAGNVLFAYATCTSDGSGAIAFAWPAGFTEILRIPGQNSQIGVGAIAVKNAVGGETDVDVTITDPPASVTTSVLLVAEYPIIAINAQTAGSILWRIVTELQLPERPQAPVPLVAMDFTYGADSTGEAWLPTPSTAQFQAAVGEPVVSVAGRLLGTGALGIRMDPDFTFHAYNRHNFGVDRTGGAFAEGVVRFERGINIASAARKIVAGGLATHVLVQGASDLYGHSIIEGASDEATRESFLAAGSQTDVAALDDMGDADLLERRRHVESLPMPIPVGDAPLLGRYIPFRDYDVADRVTVLTGDGDQDFVEQPFQIAAMTIRETTATVHASDLKVLLELGATSPLPGGSGGGGAAYGGGITSAPGGGGTGSVPPHQHNGVSHTGQLPHTTLSDVLPDQHHARDHATRHEPGGADAMAVDAAAATGSLRTLGTGPATAAPGAETPVDHGAMGAAETIALSAGSWHRGTLDAAVAITVSGFSVDEGVVVLAKLQQDGGGGNGITWDPDVLFAGDDQPDLTADAVTWYVLWSDEGDPAIYGAKIGSGATGLELLEEGVTLGDATSVDFVGAGVTVTGGGVAKTVTIPGTATTPTDASLWRPLMDGAGAVVTDGTGQAVMAYGPA